MITKTTNLLEDSSVCHPCHDSSSMIPQSQNRAPFIDAYTNIVQSEMSPLIHTRTSLLTDNRFSRAGPRSSTSTMIELAGGAFVLGAGLVIALEASPLLMLGSLSLLLLGTSSCQSTGDTEITYSEISFNTRIIPNLKPSDSIDKTLENRPVFMNAQSSDEQKSLFYPTNYLELNKLRNAETLWVSAGIMQKQSDWSLSWELIVKGLQTTNNAYSLNMSESRSCVPFTHPETGIHMMLNGPHGMEDFTTSAATSLFDFYPYTIGLEVCSITKDSSPECKTYDLRNELGLHNKNPLTQGIGCYLDAKIPGSVIPGTSTLKLFLADRNMKTDKLGIPSEPLHLTPNLKVISACETIKRPLVYRADLSGEVLVDGNKAAMRERWCWNVENNSKEMLPEFFTPDLIVKEVKTVKTSANTSTVSQTVLGEYLTVLTHDCAAIPENSSYDLEHCASGGKLSLTPTQDPQNPSETLTWCLENRIYRNLDGKYDKPRWEKDAPLYIQFKVCE